ncbi:MAG: helix-turn-helix transcriptional regulator, partial [Actinomycetota bacterium]
MDDPVISAGCGLTEFADDSDIGESRCQDSDNISAIIVLVDAARTLREARRGAGLTQRALALRAGIPQPTIARIEARTVVPRIDTLDRLLSACG